MGLRTDPGSRTDQLGRGLLLVAAILSVVLFAWLLRSATSGPPATVDTITIDNQTGLAVAVEAVGEAGARLQLGILPAGPTARYEVVDLGRTWEFVATYGGEEVARSERLSRERLAADGWRVRLAPTPATRELRRAGFQ